MLPNGKWGIKDPQKFMHTVQYEDKTFYGHENLTHCIDDAMERPYVLSALLFNIEKAPEQGEWNGYVWLKLE